MKRIRIIIMLLILLLLNGCGNRANVPFSESKAPEDTAAASETKDPDTSDDVSSQVVIRENTEETDSKEQDVKSDETAVIPGSKQPDEWNGSTETLSSQPVIDPVDEKIPDNPVSEEKAGTDSVEQEPAPISEQEPEQPPDPSREPDQEQDPEPEAEPETEPTEEPEPVFDIGYWIGYAGDEDITAVWIWYENVGTNRYLIYIGYT